MGCTWCYWFYMHFLWLSWILRRWGTELPAYAIRTAAPHMSMPSSLSVPQAVPCFPNTFQCFQCCRQQPQWYLCLPLYDSMTNFCYYCVTSKPLVFFTEWSSNQWVVLPKIGNKPPRKRPCLSKGCLLPATILEVQATLAMERSREIKEAKKCKGISNTMQMHKNRHSKDTILLKK